MGRRYGAKYAASKFVPKLNPRTSKCCGIFTFDAVVAICCQPSDAARCETVPQLRRYGFHFGP
jgi:hypothetical protein